MIGTAVVAQATAVAGYDLLTGKQWKRSSISRRLDAIAFTGSAVIGDCNIELYINAELIGEIRNSKLGNAPNRDDIIGINRNVPAGSELVAKVVTQPTTNLVVLSCYFTP